MNSPDQVPSHAATCTTTLHLLDRDDVLLCNKVACTAFTICSKLR